jgi:hypothetical protein
MLLMTVVTSNYWSRLVSEPTLSVTSKFYRVKYKQDSCDGRSDGSITYNEPQDGEESAGSRLGWPTMEISDWQACINLLISPSDSDKICYTEWSGRRWTGDYCSSSSSFHSPARIVSGIQTPKSICTDYRLASQPSNSPVPKASIQRAHGVSGDMNMRWPFCLPCPFRHWTWTLDCCKYKTLYELSTPCSW